MVTEFVKHTKSQPLSWTVCLPFTSNFLRVAAFVTSLYDSLRYYTVRKLFSTM